MATAAVVHQKTGQGRSSPVDDSTTAATKPKPKLRRVSKACGPCSLAHSACDRVRPCKRCVGQGKAHQCVDVSTGRRRGRPRRQPNDGDNSAIGSRVVPKVELDDEDSHRAGDEDDLVEPATSPQRGDRPHTRQRHHHHDDDGDEDEDDDDDESHNDCDDASTAHAKRAHIDPSFDALTRSLLEQQRSLVRELREIRSEIMQVRRTQRLHDKYFASISLCSFTPSVASSPPSSSSPPILLRRLSHPTNDIDSAHLPPSSSSSSSPPLTCPERGGSLSPAQSLTLPSSTFMSMISSDVPPPSSSMSAIDSPSFMSDLIGWEYPPSVSVGGAGDPVALGGYGTAARHIDPLRGPSNAAPLAQSPNRHRQRSTEHDDQQQRRTRRRRHAEMASTAEPLHGQQQHQSHHYPNHYQQQQYYGSIASHHMPRVTAGPGFYQKDLLIPSFAYDQMREGFNVPLVVRLEMLSYLPFLSHYNITSAAVPFAISDPRQPIVVCRAPSGRRPGQEIVTQIIYTSPSFVDLVRLGPESLLGGPCTRFLLNGGEDSMVRFFNEMTPWVTMRSSVPCSPVLSGRLMVRRGDGSQMPARGQAQFFYDEEGYFVQCMMALEVEWPGPAPPPLGLDGRKPLAQLGSGPRAMVEEADFPSAGAAAPAAASGGEAATAIFPTTTNAF